MGKRISLKPAEVLELEFADGTVKELKFTMKAIRFLTDEFKGLNAVMADARKDIPSATSKMIYCSMKACDENITLRDVENIVDVMSIVDVMKIFKFFKENMSAFKDADDSNDFDNKKKSGTGYFHNPKHKR